MAGDDPLKPLNDFLAWLGGQVEQAVEPVTKTVEEVFPKDLKDAADDIAAIGGMITDAISSTAAVAQLPQAAIWKTTGDVLEKAGAPLLPDLMQKAAENTFQQAKVLLNPNPIATLEKRWGVDIPGVGTTIDKKFWESEEGELARIRREAFKELIPAAAGIAGLIVAPGISSALTRAATYGASGMGLSTLPDVFGKWYEAEHPEVYRFLKDPEIQKAMIAAEGDVTEKLGPLGGYVYQVPGAKYFWRDEYRKALTKRLRQLGVKNPERAAAMLTRYTLEREMGGAFAILGQSMASEAMARNIARHLGIEALGNRLLGSYIAGTWEGGVTTFTQISARYPTLATSPLGIGYTIFGAAIGGPMAMGFSWIINKAYAKWPKHGGKIVDWAQEIIDPYEKPGDILADVAERGRVPVVTPTVTPTSITTVTPTETPTGWSITTTPSPAPTTTPTTTPTETMTHSPVTTPTDTPTTTPTDTPTGTPTETPSSVNVPTPSEVSTETPTPTTTPTPTPTPTPMWRGWPMIPPIPFLGPPFPARGRGGVITRRYINEVRAALVSMFGPRLPPQARAYLARLEQMYRAAQQKAKVLKKKVAPVQPVPLIAFTMKRPPRRAPMRRPHIARRHRPRMRRAPRVPNMWVLMFGGGPG